MKRKIVFASIFAVVALTCVAGLSDPPHRTDEALLENFRRHRADFERLREMVDQDKALLGVTDDRTQPDDPEAVGIPASRIAEFRALLKALGIRGGLKISADRGTIELTASARGVVTHNSSKGYMYMAAPAGRTLLDSLDEVTAKGVGSGLRRIEGNWYLFFEGY